MAKELDMLNKSLQENLDLTAYSQVGHTHNYAGSSTAGGAATSATKLATARKINGTSFNGTGDITTANWGTARTITIGNSGKSVNGSANVSWTLAEIGAAASGHTHNILKYVDTRNVNTAPKDYNISGIQPEFKSTSTIGLPSDTGTYAGTLTYQQWTDVSNWSGGKITQFATVNDGRMFYRKGDGSGWGSWYQFYTTQNKPTYSDVGAAAASHGTHVTYATATPSANGTAAVGTSSKVAREDHVHPLQTTISGAAGSAGKWTTARTLTIGNSGKSVDGSANVTWTLAEIGALPLSGGTMTGAITTPNNAQGIKIGDDAVICDRNIANHIVIEGATATSGGITFGSGKDTNIYRGGANLLKTDDTFNAVGGLQWNGESLDTRYAKASHGSHISFSTTTPKVAGTAAIGSDSGAARGDHVHPAQTSVSGNAGTATKLQTARTIALGTGVTSTATSFDGSANITIPVTGIKEAYLAWGGKNFTGGFGPIDAAMVPHLGANRLAFMPAAGVAFEYSTDGGTNWAAYSTSDANKINFFNGNGAAHFIGASTATKIDKAKYMFRVTITASTAKVYTVLNKFVIYCSTNGSTGSYCSIDARTQANVTAGTDTWVNFANKVEISGWSGYNVINTSGITVGTNSSQYGQLRFTFGVASHASTVEYAGLQVSMVMGFGGVGWTTPSTMAAKGRIYNYDANQNVTFPAQVTATQFNGPLNGNASTATKWSSARTLTIGNSGKTYDGSGNQSYSLSEIGALPTAGGTMTGNIKFADVTSTTYPAKSAMLTWNGSTDGADIYYQVDASDKGRLVLNTRDDSDCVIAFANAGTIKSTIDNSGNFSGKASKAGNADTATKFATARTITIGNQAQSFDGTANISFSVASIGAAASSHSHNTLSIKGTDTITSTANDTTAKWGAQGTSVHWYTKTGQLTDQPNQWGYLLNIGQSSEVHQLWMTQSSGDLKHRGGNSSGWSETWRTILDTSNYKTHVTPANIGAAASTHGTHVTYSTSAPLVAGTAAVGSANNVARGDHVHPAQTSVSGNAGTATKLATPRTITIGNKGKTFDGSADISYTLAEIGAATSGHTHSYAGSSSAGGAANSAVKLSSARTITIGNKANNFDGSGNISYSLADMGSTESVVWTASIKCATWSRLFQYKVTDNATVGGAYLVNIRATRSSVVYNPTLLVNFSHSTKAKIVQLNNTEYSNIKVRCVVDGNGAGYFEIYDNVNSATNSTTQSVYVTVIKLSATLGITKYTAFTDGTTVPTNYTAVGEMTTISGTVYSGTAAKATILATTRTINGTNFNGSGNITTANWGTARNLQIGNSSKSVNGSGNVSWTLAEIGAIPLTGNTGAYSITGNLEFANPSNNTFRGVVGKAGGNDYWRIGGQATADNAGYMEIATADDANEPIYVRQYSGVYSTLSRTLTLLDASGNTSMPGSLSVTKGVSCTDVTAKGNVTVTGTVKVGSVTMKYNDTSESLDFIFG